MSSTTSREFPDENWDQPEDPPPDISDVLNSAATGVIDSGRIASLSDPTRAQVEEFKLAWETLPIAARREIVREMARQSAEDLEIAFGRFFRIMARDPDTEVRAIAVKALWEDDSVAVLHELCDMAERETEAPVQESIATTLGSYSYLAEIDLLATEDRERLSSALWHLLERGGSWMARRRALESLAFIGDDEEIKSAISAWYESDFEQERAGAIVAMGRNLDVRWLPAVLEALGDEDPDIRSEAAWAAGEFMEDVAIEPLSRMVDDEDEEIRRVAILSIGTIGGKKAIDSLRYLDTQVGEDLKQVVADAIEEAEIWLEIPEEDHC